MTSNVQIVPATADMLPEILRLEEACFSAPWTRKMLAAELTGNPFAHFLAAVDQEQAGPAGVVIVGYHCFWIVFEELRLMNLAVRDSMRRRGIGEALVTEALRMGLGQSASRAVLEVRASNDAALALYQRIGFTRISTRPRYYTNPVEDAVLMEMAPLVIQSGPRPDREPVTGGGSVSAH
jgi:ribosomal-protein-alanine N-acetyltransferase